MAESLRILILEDNPADAELIQFELEEAGIIFTAKVVMTEEDFVRELQEFSPDLILSDYDLPKYNGGLALAEARRRRPDTPFILVTGAVTEDRAIDILTQGAKDYVLKTRLQQRLVPAVRRALAEAEEHRARKQAEVELREAHRTLEERVKIRTAELEAAMAAQKKMEEELHESARRLRLAHQAAGIGSFEWNVQTGVNIWTPELEAMYGLAPGEFGNTQHSWEELLHPEDRAAAVGLVNQTFETGEPVEGEWRVVWRDGSVHWITGRFQAFKDAAGQPLRLTGVNMDITERKRVEEALQDSEKRYRRLFESAKDGILILDADTGQVEDANPFLLQLLGYSYNELYGKPIWELGAFKDIAASKDAFKALQDNEYIRYKDLPLETHDGQLIAVEFISNVYLVDHHKVIQCNIRDITEQKAVELARQESEKRLRRLYESGMLGVIYWNMDGKITDANDKFLEMVGYSREEVTAGRIDWVNMTPPEHRHLDEASARELKATGVNKEPFEKEYIRKDGTRVPILVAGAMLDEARFNGVAFVLDITERKRSEEALKESEKKFRELVKYAPVGIYEIDFLNRKFVTVNESMILLTGYTREELLAMDPLDILADESKNTFMARLSKMLKGEKPDETIEYKVIAKDGHVIDAVLNMSFKFDEQRKPLGATVIGHDITARKQTEQQLRESEEKFRNLFMNMTEEVHFWKLVRDEQGQIKTWQVVDINPPTVKAWGRESREDTIGRTADEIYPGATEHFMPIVQKIMAEGIPYSYENYFPPPVDKYFRFTSIPLGEYFFTTGADITRSRKAEESLKQQAKALEDANKELESFSYSVSHDLKAPLRAIDGYFRMFLKKYGSALDEDASRTINVIRGNTEKMGVLIDDLLSFSKVLKSSTTMSEIDMDKLASEVWNDIRAANHERDLEFKITKLLPGFGDSALIRQALSNLISNAVKFTKSRKPGIIEISSYAEPGGVVYRVKDNGVGFDMAFYNKLFGVFQRLHGDEEYEGSGVGLAIVQRIIHRHGGRVWAEGEVDKGVTFYFTLPGADHATKGRMTWKT